MKRLYICLALLAVCVSAGNADARRLRGWADKQFHAVSTTPGHNQEVKSPRRITIKFSQDIAAQDASIAVTDSYGTALVSDAEVKGREMNVSLPPLSPGRYHVRWHARCNCEGATEQGDDYSFSVK